MSKARVDWLFLESPVGSDKLDQVTTDWMVHGLPIWCIADDAGGSIIDAAFAWSPYNPAKSVYNRLYVLGYAAVNGNDHATGVDGWLVSFDTGATWQEAFTNSITPPVDYFPGGVPTYAGTWDLDAEVSGFQWLGLRYGFFSVNARQIRFMAFLYNATDNPF